MMKIGIEAVVAFLLGALACYAVQFREMVGAESFRQGQIQTMLAVCPPVVQAVVEKQMSAPSPAQPAKGGARE